MTEKKRRAERIDVKGLVAGDADLIRTGVQATLHGVLKAEMREALGAPGGERTATRRSCRAGDSGRTLITRVGNTSER